ncbi:histone-lysine N-methyltransferase SETMAR [Trichonephila inaurata madagascariensis]|uniref:Histone-lysine N-methyltransferase SETMAR n=1 Tax=Trichonephila inaurata madagascariensis TaxID=2747483 RepID=A0A8X6JL15_9ARAC|nr:histone-lysine N-methyltransferase SETMAR [Trichonephila inaurata madagascariensis]
MDQRMSVNLEHLRRYHEDGNDFLFRIVSRDESWIHHFTSEAKVTSMERKSPSSPIRKKFKTTPSASKVLPHSFLRRPMSFVAGLFGGWNHQCYEEKVTWDSQIWRSVVG